MRPKLQQPVGLQPRVLHHTQDVVAAVAAAAPGAALDDTIIERLRSAVYGLRSSAQAAALTSTDIDALWRLSTRLWNHAVDCHNSRLAQEPQSPGSSEPVAWLRHFARCAGVQAASQPVARWPAPLTLTGIATQLVLRSCPPALSAAWLMMGLLPPSLLHAARSWTSSQTS